MGNKCSLTVGEQIRTNYTYLNTTERDKDQKSVRDYILKDTWNIVSNKRNEPSTEVKAAYKRLTDVSPAKAYGETHLFKAQCIRGILVTVMRMLPPANRYEKWVQLVAIGEETQHLEFPLEDGTHVDDPWPCKVSVIICFRHAELLGFYSTI
jgi:hypothetical protein